MAISGLVITLASPAHEADAALHRLAADPRLTLGERFGQRLAAVAETPGVDTDRAMWDDLRQIPGVVHVDVTFVALDPSPDGTSDTKGITP